MNHFILNLIFGFWLSIQPSPRQDLIINNITVIDPVSETMHANQTIYIQGDRITKIENDLPGSVTSDAAIINGQGKFIMAGFWNMHTHICWHPDLDEDLFPVLFSYGITGVRDMGGDLGVLNEFKKGLKNHLHRGPIIYGPGPLIDGEKPIHPEFSVALTDENCRKVLDSLRKGGADFLKVYSLLPKELVKRVADYSKEMNIPFAGHVSEYMTAYESAKLGMKSFEHLNRIEDIADDQEELDRFVREVRSNESWVCPTLVIYKRKVDVTQGMDISHPLDSVIDKYLRGEWTAFRERRVESGSDPGMLITMRGNYEKQKELVRKLREENLQLLIGSDFGGMPYIYPGYGLHEEMALWQDIGFETYDILRKVSYDPARFFNITAEHGSVEKGKIADLVILNTNPVIDIRNAKDIHAVIRSGKVVFGSN